MKVYLVDGTYELFRAYYGPPGGKNAAGVEVGATRALMRSLLSLIEQEKVTHIACAFDTVIESFRNELFAGYKTGAGIDPELYAQFALAERATRALGIVTWSMIEFEADDALATAAERYASDPRVEQVLICSPDKDLAQCVRGDRIILYDRLRKKHINEAGVLEKFGVPPAAIPDWLALVGDNADGIPGVPQFGPKSAAALLRAFGTLEAVPLDARRWHVPVRGAERLVDLLRSEREAAGLYKVLATLRKDVPLGEALDDLEWRGANRDALTALCDELGFPKLLESGPRFRS